MADPILIQTLFLATLAGASIPVGAWLGSKPIPFMSDWMDTETRHGVMAFGAGALLAAVALVLIPEGSERLQPAPALFWLVAGGILFALVDARLSRSKTRLSQFVAMMMDYLPEALALGAVITGDLSAAVLVAVLISLQNLPEGYNAMREMSQDQAGGKGPLLWLFAAMVPLGPLCAVIGLSLPAHLDPAVGAVMMLSAGGIMYLMFQDIAPQVPLENTMLPRLGAVLGFALGLAGHLLV